MKAQHIVMCSLLYFTCAYYVLEPLMSYLCALSLDYYIETRQQQNKNTGSVFILQ